jgi:hypothetical protein
MEPEFHPVVAVDNKQRWLEIRDTKGFVVTVIEVLSPSNKDQHRAEYTERRQNFIEAGANYVEIDLLRSGQPLFAAPRDKARPYSVAVYRVTMPERFELYRVSLRDRLPCFRVPLRAKDADVPLDLQPLINRVYAKGRYWLNDHSKLPTTALNEADAAWALDILKGAGLR